MDLLVLLDPVEYRIYDEELMIQSHDLNDLYFNVRSLSLSQIVRMLVVILLLYQYNKLVLYNFQIEQDEDKETIATMMMTMKP